MLEIDLRGKKAFVAGIGDDNGYGFAIAKVLAEAGAEIIIGTWAPILKIFKMSWEAGKFDASRQLSNGSLLEYSALYPIDASFDTMEEVLKIALEKPAGPQLATDAGNVNTATEEQVTH